MTSEENVVYTVERFPLQSTKLAAYSGSVSNLSTWEAEVEELLSVQGQFGLLNTTNLFSIIKMLIFT